MKKSEFWSDFKLINNKKLATIIASLSILTTFLGNVPNDSAAEISEDKTFYSEEFGNYVIPFSENEDGDAKVLSEKEIADENSLNTFSSQLDDSESTEDVDSINSEERGSTKASYREYLKFKPTKTTNYVGDPLKVVSDIGCTTSSCSIGHGVTYTKTITVTYGAASDLEKSLIKSSLNIGYSSAKASTSSYTFNLKKGEYGYIAFKPYKVKKSGYFLNCGNQGTGCHKTSKTGYVRLPKKLSNGKADGIFYFVYTSKK
jgi:hypothetical protein